MRFARTILLPLALVTSSALANPTITAFSGDVAFDSETTLFFELGGAAAGAFDRYEITGSVSLDARLSFGFVGSLQPGYDQSFEILSVDGSLAGLFRDKSGAPIASDGFAGVVGNVPYFLSYGAGGGSASVELSSEPAPADTAAIGVATFGGDLRINNASTLTIEIAGALDSDQVVVGGDLTLEGGPLNVSMLNGAKVFPGQVFEIIDVGGATSGSFAGLGEGDVVTTIDGIDLRISYTGGDGNDVVLFVPPLVPLTDAPCFERTAVDSFARAESIVIGDLDGDGDLDLVASSPDVDGFGTFAWYRNDGADPPGFERRELAAMVDFNSAAIADMNDDTLPDIVAGGRLGAPGAIAVFINDGLEPPGFTLSAVTNGLPPQQITSVSTADLNGDGFPEILSSIVPEPDELDPMNPEGIGPATMFVHVNSRNGVDYSALTLADAPADLPGKQLIAVDLVGDATPELITASIRPNVAFAWYAIDDLSGMGMFTVNAVPSGLDVSGPAIAHADLDGDGDEDVIVGSSNLAANANVLAWYENRLNESMPFVERDVFVPQGGTSAVARPRNVRAADVDGDGDPDIVVTSENDSTLALYLNDGVTNDDRFSQAIVAQDEDGVRGLAIGDVNNDGDTDIVTSALPSVNGSDSRAIALFSAGSVLNADSGDVSSGLDAAVRSAGARDVLRAERSAFSEDCLDTLDFLGKPVEIRADRAIEVPTGVSVRLSDESVLSVDMGERIDIAGSVVVPALADAMIDADAAGITGDLDIGSGSSLGVTGPVTLRGGASLTPQGPLTQLNLNGVFEDLLPIDADGDGNLDLAYTQAAATGLTLLFNDGNAMPELGVASGTSGSIGASNGLLLAADIDGNGTPDIVQAQDGVGLVWYENTSVGGTVSFTERLIRSESGDFVSFDAGQLTEGDSDVDLVAAFGNSIRWYDNPGGGATPFAFAVVASGFGGSADPIVRIGDLDDDGNNDIVALIGGNDARLVWYRNQGGASPVFTVPPTVISDAIVGDDLSVIDIDDDGDLDVFLDSNGSFVWFDNDDGDNTFTQRTIVSRSIGSAVIARTLDIDADGDIDVLASDESGSGVEVFENNGASPPVFTRRAFNATGNSIAALGTGDIDGDGDPDAIIGTDAGVFLEWLANTRDGLIEIASNGASLDAASDLLLRNTELRLANGSSVNTAGGIDFDRRTTVSGSGVLQALQGVRSAGALAPDVGQVLTIAGDYEQRFTDPIDGQTDSGDLRIDLGDGMSPNGTLASVTGSATLAGGLIVNADGEVDPPPMVTRFDVLQANAVIGTFDVGLLPPVTPDAMGRSRFLRIEYPSGPPIARGTATVSVVVDSLDEDIESESAAIFNIDGEPVAAASDDLNGDGFVDIALAIPDLGDPDGAPGQVLVLLNRGLSGSEWLGYDIDPAGTIQLAVGIKPSAIDIGNFDDLGGLDIAVANELSDNVFVFTNDGAPTPTFTLGPVLSAGDAPVSIAFGNLNNDGLDDLAIAASGSEEVRVFENAGAGYTPLAPLATAPFRPGVIGWGNLDNDKWDDLAVALTGDALIRAYRNVNDGIGLGLTTVDIPTGESPQQLIIAPLDAGGTADLAVTNRASDSISVVLSNSDFSFQPSVELPIGNAPDSLAPGDFDNDGDLDIAYISQTESGRRIETLRNDLTDGQLVFTPSTDQNEGNLDPGGVPFFVFAGDADNDGRTDIIALASTETGTAGARGPLPLSRVGVALQPGCPGDTNGDGMTSTADITFIVSNLGAGSPGAVGTPGDADGDGVTATADITFVVSNLGCTNVPKAAR
ncbi:MAG: FG-GAP-like repeat-containing protein [Planctomycetota bacterium]